MNNTIQNQIVTIKICSKNVFVILNQTGEIHKIAKTQWQEFKKKGFSDRKAALIVIKKNECVIHRKNTLKNISL